MELSERDRLLLAQIERGLGKSDPRWVERMGRRPARLGRAYLAVAGFVVGVIVLVAGAALAQRLLYTGVGISLGGFAVMLAAVCDLCFGRSRIVVVKKVSKIFATRLRTSS